jgi:hypothetical protein
MFYSVVVVVVAFQIIFRAEIHAEIPRSQIVSKLAIKID